MAQEEAIKLFGSKQIRIVWDSEKEKYFFSIVDVIQVLTDSVDATAYWRKLKQRLKAEGNETVTNCHALRLTAADGKQRLTDVADTEQVLRLIQFVPFFTQVQHTVPAHDVNPSPSLTCSAA